jgi:DNA-binding NarL/FixJ family response regulator
MADEPRKPRIRKRRIIERPRLIRALDKSSARIRMLVAGSGYGKTTLAEQWAPRDGRTVGWYRARRSAADVAVVAQELASATDAVVPGAGRRLLERLSVTPDPEREATLLAEMLAEDLDDWPDGGWVVIDDYQRLAESIASEAFVETLVEHSSIRILIASRVRPTWVNPKRILEGAILEIPQNTLAMMAEEIEEVLEGGRTELTSGLVALAGGWPAVVGLAGMAPDVGSGEAVLPETLYEHFAGELYRSLDADVRSSLAVLAAMPLVDRELAETILGPERARRVCEQGMDLGVLEDRDGRLELHPLAESFFSRHTGTDARIRTLEVFPTLWAYYMGLNEPDAAFDLANQLGAPGDIDRVLVDSMDDLLNSARLSTLETWAAKAEAVVGSTSAVLLAQAEIALHRGRHLTAQTLADRAAHTGAASQEELYRAYLVGGQAAHFGQREEDALALFQHAEKASQTGAQQRRAKWGRLTAAASLELDVARDLLLELEVSPRGVFDPTEAVRTADKKLALGLRFGTAPNLADARNVDELLPSVPDPYVRGSFRCMFSCALNLAAEYSRALEVATAMMDDAVRYRVEYALVYAPLMQGTAHAGLRSFDEAHACIMTAYSQAVRCTDDFGQQAVYAARVRSLLHQGRVAEACSLEPPDLTHSLPGMRGEVFASRGLALACLGRLDEARKLADLAVADTRAIEATLLARCTHVVAALKSRHPALTDEVRQLVDHAWEARGVDYIVTSYRASPDLLVAMFRDSVTAERAAYIVGRASDHDLAASVGVDLADALDPVSTLSAREREVYDLLCGGLSNRDIAARLFISVETVKVHARHVYDKLGIRSRTALALNAARRPRSGNADGNVPI